MREETNHVMAIVCDDVAGVLLRIVGLFARRGFNIEGISAGTTEDPSVFRITVVIKADDQSLIQISNQVRKLHDVREVSILNPDDSVLREHVLICAGSSAEQCASLIQIANLFQAKIVNVGSDNLMMELTGEPRKIDSFIRLLKPFGIKRVMRSGLSALERD